MWRRRGSGAAQPDQPNAPSPPAAGLRMTEATAAMTAAGSDVQAAAPANAPSPSSSSSSSSSDSDSDFDDDRDAEDRINDARQALLQRQQAADGGGGGGAGGVDEGASRLVGAGFWGGDAGMGFSGALFAPGAALSDLSCLTLPAHLDEEALVQAVLEERRARMRAERRAERVARRATVAETAEAMGRLPALLAAAAAEAEAEAADDAANAKKAGGGKQGGDQDRQQQQRHHHRQQQHRQRQQQQDDERSYVPYLRMFGEELARYGVRIPTVTVEYRNLRATARATVGKRGVASVSNACLAPWRALLLRAGSGQRAEKRVLRGVSGVLDPGRPTLLLAPPGAGKTVLMRALAGRYPKGGTGTLRLEGGGGKGGGHGVSYNGLDVHSGRFAPARVAAFVSQLDFHVPILTVGETISFANACASVSPAAAARARAALVRQAEREAAHTRRRLRGQHQQGAEAHDVEAGGEQHQHQEEEDEEDDAAGCGGALFFRRRSRRGRATPADVFNMAEQLVEARTRERLARVRAASRVASVSRVADWVVAEEKDEEEEARNGSGGRRASAFAASSSAAAAVAADNDDNVDVEARLAALARVPSGITDDEDPLLRAVAPAASATAANGNGGGGARSAAAAVAFAATPPASTTATTPAADDAATASARREFYKLMHPAASSRELRAELILRIMGLEHVRGTLVGDAMVRGVSGGQRHRVTCAEALAGPSRVLLMDEISTGLDSATLHGIVAAFNASARALGTTLVCSLLQPPPEVVALYDDLLLLAGGRVLFHGPVGEAVPFFESLGFRMPARKEPAAWLMELTTAPGQMLYATPELRAERLLGLGAEAGAGAAATTTTVPPRTAADEDATDDDDDDDDGDDYDPSDPPPPQLPETLRRALASDALPPTDLPAGVSFPLLVPLGEVSRRFWRSWPSGSSMRRRLRDRPFDPSTGHPSALPGLSFATTGMESLSRALKRQAVLLRRDPSLLRGRITQCAWIALVIGALFWQLPVTLEGVRSYYGAFFLCTLFMVTGNGPSVMAVRLSLPVWFKHRSMHLYPSWAQGAAVAVVQSLPSLVDALLFSAIVYWMCGFAREASRFFTFLLVMMCQSCAMGSLYRLLGAAAKTLTDTQTAGSVLVLLLTLTSGYMLLRPDIPVWLMWLYWLSPYAYTMRSLAVNEFTSAKWSSLPPDPRFPPPPFVAAPPKDLGQQALQTFAFFTEPYWIWVGVAYLAGLAVALSVATGVAYAFATPPPRVPNVESARQREARLARDRAALGAVVVTGVEEGVKAAVEDGGGGASAAAQKTTAATKVAPVAVAAAAPVTLPPSSASSSSRPAAANGADDDDGLPECPPITLVWQDLSYFVPMPAAVAAAAKKKKGKRKRVAKLVGDTGKEEEEDKGKGKAAAATPPPPPASPAATTATTNPQAAAASESELQLLHSLTGFARPGDLVALMGGSGAGKSTLMDVLAQRKTVGRVAGSVTVNGFPAHPATWPRVHGYCEQMDVHSPGQLVEEALLTSAQLRLPRGTSRAAVRRCVDEALQMVDLDSLRGAPVGDATGSGGAGLTVEQRKRLTIAVELVARPSVVFMDEPTSGLDARAAAVVMRGVRNVARSGRAVVVTIHQPSVEIFESFDRLYLMHRGGRCDYFGDLGAESRELVAYLRGRAEAESEFAGLGGDGGGGGGGGGGDNNDKTTAAAIAATTTTTAATPPHPPLELPPLPEGLNPATWMLDATSKGRADFWPSAYARSALAARNAAEAQALVDGARAAPGAAPLVVKGITRGGYAQPLPAQTLALVRKFSQVYWRTPSYNATRLALALGLALLYGVMYFGQGGGRAATMTPGQIQAIMAMLYNSQTMMGAINMMMAMPLCASERIVFYRERGGRAYDPLAYGLAQIVLEVPYLVAQAAVFCPIAYFMIGFFPSAQKFFYFTLMFLLCLALYSMIAQALIASTPSMAVAMVFQTAVQLGFNIFGGFVIAYPAIPGWLKWVNRLVPSTWLLYGIAGSQLADSSAAVEYGGRSTTVESYMKTVFDYDRALVPYMPLIVLAYIFFFRTIGILSLKYINYLKR